jgi:hypothetical protein
MEGDGAAPGAAAEEEVSLGSFCPLSLPIEPETLDSLVQEATVTNGIDVDRFEAFVEPQEWLKSNFRPTTLVALTDMLQIGQIHTPLGYSLLSSDPYVLCVPTTSKTAICRAMFRRGQTMVRVVLAWGGLLFLTGFHCCGGGAAVQARHKSNSTVCYAPRRIGSWVLRLVLEDAGVERIFVARYGQKLPLAHCRRLWRGLVPGEPFQVDLGCRYDLEEVILFSNGGSPFTLWPMFGSNHAGSLELLDGLFPAAATPGLRMTNGKLYGDYMHAAKLHKGKFGRRPKNADQYRRMTGPNAKRLLGVLEMLRRWRCLGGFRLELCLEVTNSARLQPQQAQCLFDEALRRLGSLHCYRVRPQDVVQHAQATWQLMAARGCFENIIGTQPLAKSRLQTWALLANMLGYSSSDILRCRGNLAAFNRLWPDPDRVAGASDESADDEDGVHLPVPEYAQTPEGELRAKKDIMAQLYLRFAVAASRKAQVKQISLAAILRGYQMGPRQPDTLAGKQALVEYVYCHYGLGWEETVASKRTRRGALPVRVPDCFHLLTYP